MHEAAGDEFADWYGALWPRVLRAVTVSVGDPDLAEEATAEAFVKALVRWPKPLEYDSPSAWLHTVAVNEIRSRWRRAKLERRFMDRLANDLRQHAPPPELRDDAVWTAVAALPDRARQVVALRYVLDLPESQIAASLGITRGTVASTLNGARKRLRTVLAPHTESTHLARTTSEELS
jgi:RNA polymerase sigma-70 factor (ECF subfamily)